MGRGLASPSRKTLVSILDGTLKFDASSGDVRESKGKAGTRVLQACKKWKHLEKKQPGLMFDILKALEPIVYPETSRDTLDSAEILLHLTFGLRQQPDNDMAWVTDSRLADVQNLVRAAKVRYEKCNKPLAEGKRKAYYYTRTNDASGEEELVYCGGTTECVLCLGDAKQIEISEPMNLHSRVFYFIERAGKRSKRELANVVGSFADEDNFTMPNLNEHFVFVEPEGAAAASSTDAAAPPPAGVVVAAIETSAAAAATPPAKRGRGSRASPSASPPSGGNGAAASENTGSNLVHDRIRQRLEDQQAAQFHKNKGKGQKKGK